MKNKRSNAKVRQSVIGVIACIAVLAVGFSGFGMMADSKKAPGMKKVKVKPIAVETLSAEFNDKQVYLSGYGEIEPLNIVEIAPEVSGTVTRVHKNLEEGGYVGIGEVLFQIDERDYRAEKTKAAVSVRQYENSIRQLKLQQSTDAKRSVSVKKNTGLALAEYKRLKKLYDEDRVGTRSDVESAEQDYNSLLSTEEVLDQTISLYPLQIEEARNSLESAKADLETAALNLERCTVKAPFTGRVKEVNVEKMQQVSSGVTAVTLADDSVLEAHIPLSYDTVSKWINFETGTKTENPNWFNGLEKSRCQLTVGGDSHQAEVARVVRFDADSRTIVVAVRAINQEDSSSMPLVDGMFATVKIPGKVLENTVMLPSHAVSTDSTVFIAENGRLKTVEVNIQREEGDMVFVSGGLKENDKVITTKLVNPLENAIVSVENDDDSAADKYALVEKR